MKTKHILSCLLVLAAAGALAGCASDNYNKAAGTATALNESAGLVAKGGRQIDRTLAALNDLLTNSQPDLRGQFNAFDNSVNELGATARDVEVKDEAMQAQGAAYFDEWDKELAGIRNEDIRTRSEARKTEVTARFARLSAQYDETKAEFRPLMSDLRDVQKFLATDLTTDGLAAIKDPAAKANHDAVPVQESMVKLSREFDELGVSLSPNTAAK